ncbi:MAG: AsmA-like C-terminal domain-containing protein [Deltaproteobacteria bacterium]|nr:AsmA-like C-terminal domain-containing protein [Deltaproteobacteria bacterium]
MKKKSRIIILACALIFIALAWCAPLFIDSAALKNKFSAELSRALHADVRIERVGLSLLMRPHLSLHGVTCSVQKSYSLVIQEAYIYPSLQALLAGRMEPGLISLEAPELHVQLPRQQAADKPEASPQEKQKKAAALIEAAIQSLPACEFEISDGTAGLAQPDGTEFVLHALDAEMAGPADGVALSVSCASQLWKKLSFTVLYRPAAASAAEAEGNAPAVRLALEARGVDMPASRDRLRAFAGTDPLVSSICSHIHGGEIRSVSLTAHLLRISDPLASAVISGRGSFENMHVAFPDMGLDVQELSGGFELDNGSIAGSRISARLGKSRIRESAVRLDRPRGFKPSLIVADFDLDLSEAPGLLHLIPDPDVRSEIELIKNPRGTGRGRFTLRAEGDAYTTEIAIKELLLQSGYRDFPPDLELRRGICTYRAGLLSFSHFSGKLGSSTLPDFSLSFSLRDDDDQFTATGKGATIAFGDLHKVFASFEPSRALIENITGADGRVDIQDISLSGPLTKTAQWSVALDATVDNLSLAAAGFDGPVAVRSGVLKADQHACTLSQADMTFLDATLAGSFTFECYLAGLTAAKADVRGTLGEKALASAPVYLGLPPALALRAPVKIEQCRLVWHRGGVTTCAGDFSLARNIKAGLNLRADNTTLEINELKIRDSDSQCRLGMKIQEDLVSISYAGMLKKATLDGALLQNSFLQGWIQGDFKAAFNQKNPRASSARGTLSWEKAGYPAFDASPVNITSASISARGSRLVVESAGLTAGQDSAGLGGSVDFTDDGFVMDLHLTAESIDLDAFKQLLSGDNASSGGAGGEFWETPLRGTVRLKARELKKDPFVCRPFNARFSFADKAVTMTAEDTKICSIALPATVRITPEAIVLEARPRVVKSPMKEVFQCLTGEKAIITGTVDIEGSVRSEGKPDALLDALAGNFLITAQDGRIYKSGLFAKILSFLSISNLLSGGIRDMAKEGYAYQSLRIEGDIQGQTMQVRRAVLISSSFTLVCQGTLNFKSREVDLDALATPFQIQNQVLSRIPLVGSTLSKPMLGVPLKISGMLDDPQISSRATAAVTKGLMDITKDIIKLPIRIIDPFLLK